MERLETICRRIDGRGYRAYRDLSGQYSFHGMTHVIRRTALADYLARAAADQIHGEADTVGRPRRGSGGSGRIQICPCGQEILPRSNVEVFNDEIVLRLTAGLPAAGRRILGREAFTLLARRIPAIVEQSMLARARAGGVSAIDTFPGGAGDRALARPLEIAAALNRLRGLSTKH